MRHQKTFRRPDGSKLQVNVILLILNFDDQPFWHHSVQKYAKGKRLMKSADLTEATDEEIQQAKAELWQRVKP